MFHIERGKEETASKGKGEKRKKLTLYKVKLRVHYNHVEVIRMKQMETKERTEEGKKKRPSHIGTKNWNPEDGADQQC